MHLRAVGGVLCACDRGVRVLDAQYFDDAGDQPRVRIVVEADQHDVACGRICRRGGDHGSGVGGGLIAVARGQPPIEERRRNEAEECSDCGQGY